MGDFVGGALDTLFLAFLMDHIFGLGQNFSQRKLNKFNVLSAALCAFFLHW